MTSKRVSVENFSSSLHGLTLGLLKQIISYPTTSLSDGSHLLAWISSLFQNDEMVTIERLEAGTGNDNLILTRWPHRIEASDETPGIVLLGHYDVVPANNDEWATDPYRLDVRGDRLYGRGVSDMKGFVAAALSNLLTMPSSAVSSPVRVILTADEEVGCKGAHALKEHFPEYISGAGGMIIGEPTQSRVVTAHKSKANYMISVKTEAKHSSLGPFSPNSISVMTELLETVAMRNTDSWRTMDQGDLRFDFPAPWINVGRITGGTAPNVIADYCEAVFEVRVPPSFACDAVFNEIFASFKEVVYKQAGTPETVSLSAEKLSESPGFVGDDDSCVAVEAFMQTGQSSGDHVDFGTEAGVLGCLAPTIVWGPGSIGQAHSVNEWMGQMEYRRYINSLQSVVAKMASDGIGQ